MSIPFNDTSTRKGLLQFYERELGFDAGAVAGNTTKLKDFAADVNLAVDDYTAIVIRASGKWQWDDSNHEDYPIITTNIVAGQRSYLFTTDEQGNLILDIYKVLAADSTGRFQELDNVDAQSDEAASGFWDGQNLTGQPRMYDKTANGIFLDPIPNYNYTNGLKIYINREANYFDHEDTSKKPGVPGIHHEYFFIKPAFMYARRKGLKDFARLQEEVIKWEGDERLGIKGKIQTYFAERPKDERRIISAAYENNR